MNTDELWADLVTTAVIGTDRRTLPDATRELAMWSTESDPAVALLERAAAVTTMRRAGARPLSGAPRLRQPAPDTRPPCPPAAARVLGWLLRRGERELLHEWLTLAEGHGCRLPAEHGPALFRRTAGDPVLGELAQKVGGPLVEWLREVFGAELAPATGARSERAVASAAFAAGSPGEPGSDIAGEGGDPVAAVVDPFVSGGAGARRAQLRAAVLALPTLHLHRLADALDEISGQPLTAPLRCELADLARLRARVIEGFAARAPGRDPSSTPR